MIPGSQVRRKCGVVADSATGQSSRFFPDSQFGSNGEYRGAGKITSIDAGRRFVVKSEANHYSARPREFPTLSTSKKSHSCSLPNPSNSYSR